MIRVQNSKMIFGQSSCLWLHLIMLNDVKWGFWLTLIKSWKLVSTVIRLILQNAIFRITTTTVDYRGTILRKLSEMIICYWKLLDHVFPTRSLQLRLKIASLESSGWWPDHSLIVLMCNFHVACVLRMQTLIALWLFFIFHYVISSWNCVDSLSTHLQL